MTATMQMPLLDTAPAPSRDRASLDRGFVARMRTARHALQQAREALPEVSSIGHFDDVAETDRQLARLIAHINREIEPLEWYEPHTATEWGGPR